MIGIQTIKSFTDFFIIIGLAILFTLFFYFLYRKIVYSIFDPMFLFALAMVFSSTMMVICVSNLYFIFQFFSFQLFFAVGLNILNPNLDKHQNINNNSFTNISLATLKVAVLFAFLIVFAVNIYSGMKVGFALFSESPTVSKITSFTDGLGFIRRINWGISNFVTCGIFLLLLQNKNSKLYWFIAIIQILFGVLGGGKTALFSYAVILVAILYHPFYRSQINLKKYKFQIVIFVSIVVSIATFILVKDSYFGKKNFLFIIFNKLYYSGDVILYYYTPVNQQYFENYNLLNYLDQITNPILGLLRIEPYHLPYGNIMVVNWLHQYYPEIKLASVLGPNNVFYVDGYIHFGLVGGMIYSLLLGMFISYIRRIYFCFSRKDIISFVVILIIFINIITLAQEVGLFISRINDTFIILIPLIVISYFFVLIFRIEKVAYIK